MPKFDVTDEAVIDAKPIVVYEAILHEFSGVTHWWPMTVYKLRGASQSIMRVQFLTRLLVIMG